MLARFVGLLLAATTLLTAGCDLLEPEGPSPEEIGPPLDLSFGGALSGTVDLAAELDPTLLRVGAFRARAEVETELANGDLGTAEISLYVRTAGTVEVSIASDQAVGIDRYLFEPQVLATVADDEAHSWDLPLPAFGSGEYLVVAWYDEDGDGTLALSYDGPGSEYADSLSKPKPSVEPDFRLTLELVWWENNDWIGNAAGLLSMEGWGHEEPLSTAGPTDWEAEISSALRP